MYSRSDAADQMIGKPSSLWIKPLQKDTGPQANNSNILAPRLRYDEFLTT